MDYFIFTGSTFFQHISNDAECTDLNTSYHEFSQTVFHHCMECGNYRELLLTLAYTEIELQTLYEYRLSRDTGERKEYAHKAVLLIRQTLELLKNQVPPLTSTCENPKEEITSTPALHWTGNAVDLVEIIYGIDEMKCINNGDMPLGELAAFFYTLLGVESKECYRFYTDIKHRKNESRTYFLDKMQGKLNERMQRDDEKEIMRK